MGLSITIAQTNPEYAQNNPATPHHCRSIIEVEGNPQSLGQLLSLKSSTIATKRQARKVSRKYRRIWWWWIAVERLLAQGREGGFGVKTWEGDGGDLLVGGEEG